MIGPGVAFGVVLCIGRTEFGPDAGFMPFPACIAPVVDVRTADNDGSNGTFDHGFNCLILDDGVQACVASCGVLPAVVEVVAGVCCVNAAGCGGLEEVVPGP